VLVFQQPDKPFAVQEYFKWHYHATFRPSSKLQKPS
jgi:hypothetical protein